MDINSDKNSVVQQEERDKSLFRKLASFFYKKDLALHPEINPEAVSKDELPPTTQDKDRTEDNVKSLSDIISGYADSTRSLESDRYLRYRDYEEMCLSGDTKISLLNGRSITIKDWAENYLETNFYIYAYDTVNNEVVPAIGCSPRITRINSPIVKIKLSNDLSIKCTPDHKIMMFDGKYKEAGDLKPGDVVKSLCRRISTKSRDGLDGYEMFQEEGWKFTHRMVAEKELKTIPSKFVDVHHLNEDKRNNDPKNLRVMVKGAHINEHEKKYIAEQMINPLFDIKDEGINPHFKDTFLNSKEIVVVEEIEIGLTEENLYDISVPKYFNFLLDCGVFVHNCSDPLIGGCVETYADEATQKDVGNRPFIIKAPDKKLEKQLNELFFDKLKIDDYLWKIAYEMCKYGETFYEIIFSRKLDDILYLKFVNPYKMFRVEKEGKLRGFKYLPDTNSWINRKEEEIFHQISMNPNKEVAKHINPYKIVHFKIDDNRYAPYGRSILDTGRTTWKQLKLLEDAVIVYRLTRSPERRVWYIDTGQLSTDKALAYTEKVKTLLRKKPIIDPLTGKVTDDKKAIAMVEDFWIPVRQGATGNKIETLPGVQRLGEIDDLQYFRDKILYYMRIPKAFFADETSIQTSGKTLASMDIFFGRAIERVQTFIEKGLYKIAYIYLILKGAKPDKIKQVDIKMTSPSIFAESARLEILTNKFNLLGNIKQTQIFPDVWILKEIMGLSDEEIIAVIGVMQAQNAGQDIIRLLTGAPNPYIPIAQPSVEQQMSQQLGAPPEGGMPPEAGAEVTPPPAETSSELTPPTESPLGLEPSAQQKKLGKTISPTDLAIKALLSLESKLPAERIKLITEVIRDRGKMNTDKAKILLETIKDRRESQQKMYNGMTYSLIIGELHGLMEEVKNKRKLDVKEDEEGMLSEQPVQKVSPPKSVDEQIDRLREKLKKEYEGQEK